jgi:hypothetical protein
MSGADVRAWSEVMCGYDAVLSATDERIGALAVQLGIPLAFYDPLAWYWKDLPPFASGCLYLAQDFIGARERLEAEAPNAVVVPPLCVPGNGARTKEFPLTRQQARPSPPRQGSRTSAPGRRPRCRRCWREAGSPS